MLDLPWITALPDSVTIVLFKQPRFFFIKNADFYAPSIAIFLINRIHLKHDRTIFSVSSHFRLYKKRPQKCVKGLTCRNTLCIIHSFTASQLHSFTASQLHSFTAFFYTPVLSFFLISLCMYKEQNGFSMNLFYYINRYR